MGYITSMRSLHMGTGARSRPAACVAACVRDRPIASRPGWRSGSASGRPSVQFNLKVPEAKAIDLATCSFVEHRPNVLLVGQAGVGKSHIAQALGHRACRAGYQVLYVGAGDMLKQLRAAAPMGATTVGWRGS